MLEKFKKIIEEATPEEKLIAKGMLLGGGLMAGAWFLSIVFPHVPDPANRVRG
jgi:hypothetical protein